MADHKEDDYVFRFKASMRFNVMAEFHDRIIAQLGTPYHCHKKGEKMGSKIWDNDILIIRSPLSIDHSFDDHIEWFSNKLMPHMSFLSEIKEQSGGEIDLFLSYSTNCDTGGFTLSANSLKILNEFAAIGILPGGFSVMFY